MQADGDRIVYLQSLHDVPEENGMKFRLTYEGPLRPSQGEARNGQREPLAAHKHAIRRVFHAQLKELWRTNKFLRECKVDSDNWVSVTAVPADQVNNAGFYGIPDVKSRMMPLSEAIAYQYRENNYRFVPLVCERFDLLCSLEILMLRRDFPLSSLIHAGDLDNRLKTLIDALRRPRNGTELKGNENPAEGEDPFYCLLEDDDLVSGLAVQSDMLLAPLSNGSMDEGDVKIVVSVELKPEYVTMFNLSFA